jgi:hypothetical protein
MLVTFECTLVSQRLRNLRELRSLQTPKQAAQVYRYVTDDLVQVATQGDGTYSLSKVIRAVQRAPIAMHGEHVGLLTCDRACTPHSAGVESGKYCLEKRCFLETSSRLAAPVGVRRAVCCVGRPRALHGVCDTGAKCEQEQENRHASPCTGYPVPGPDPNR